MSLTTWHFAHDGTRKDTADRISVGVSSVSIDEVYELFDIAWEGGTFFGADLVDPSVIQQAERDVAARRLFESPAGGTNPWSQLQEAS